MRYLAILTALSCAPAVLSATTAQAKRRGVLSRIRRGTRSATRTVTSGVNSVAKSVASTSKRWANKVRVAPAEIMASIAKIGGQVYFKYLPGKMALLQKELLARKRTPKRAKVASAIRSSRARSVAGADALPSKVTRYEAYYNETEGATEPPASVDHRKKQSSIDNQMARGTCTAFASMAALEAMRHNKAKLSKEYAYWLYKDKGYDKVCKSGGAYLSDVADTMSDHGFPDEGWYTYWLTASHAVRLCPPGPTEIAKGKANTRAAKVIWIPEGSTGVGQTNTRFLEAVLAAGHDIVIGAGVAWSNKGHLGGVLDVRINSSTNEPVAASGGHAMLIVGYDRTGNSNHGGGTFWVKNSWGTDVGHAGYLKLSYDYIREYLNSAFFITGLKR